MSASKGTTYEPGLIVKEVRLPADSAAGDAVAETNFGLLLTSCTVLGVWITPDGAVTANDTNYATITVAIGGSTLEAFLTKITGGTGDWTDNTPLEGTSDLVRVAASPASPKRLAVTVAKAASGVQLPGYVVTVALRTTEEVVPA